MPTIQYFRGGNSLKPKLHEVRIDPATGLLRTTHGVSVFNRPDNLARFGGAYRLGAISDTLKVIQRGRDPHHFEIVPAQPMTLVEYEEALDRIVLTSV
jgi:hypothetical protein